MPWLVVMRLGFEAFFHSSGAGNEDTVLIPDIKSVAYRIITLNNFNV